MFSTATVKLNKGLFYAFTGIYLLICISMVFSTIDVVIFITLSYWILIILYMALINIVYGIFWLISSNIRLRLTDERRSDWLNCFICCCVIAPLLLAISGKM